MEKIKIGFICVGNSCRSQMAEGFAKHYGGDVIEAYSAGTNPASEISPNAILAMQEKGVDISFQYPKSIREIPSDLDIVVTMGCDVECPYVPAKYHDNWELDDPVGMPLAKFREVRNRIEKKVNVLVDIIRKSKNVEEVIQKMESDAERAKLRKIEKKKK